MAPHTPRRSQHAEGHQVLRARVEHGSSTASVTGAPRAKGIEAQIGALPDPVRLQMSLVARQAASADEALEPVLALLVSGSPAKLQAIATAFRTNEPLREQWERTFEILRA